MYKEEDQPTIIPQDQWPTLSVDELLNQKNILYSKWEFLASMQKPYGKEYAVALNLLEDLIAKKLNPEDSNTPRLIY